MLKILELFSGYGGANFALTKAGINHECIGYSDIEKCANYIYKLNHGKDVPQLGDVTQINTNKLSDFDLLTGGFPCQSFSIAGKREGFEAENKGQLFFEIIRIAKAKQPRYMLLENVEGILSHDNGKTLRVVLQELKRIGYHVKWKKMLSKNHGTPQLRPRVWFACFRRIEDYNKFMFPEKEKLKLTVKDLLEEDVDKKYYLKPNQLKRLFSERKNSDFKNPKPQELDKPIRTLTSHMSKDQCDVPFFKIADYRNDEGIRVRKDNICPTLASRKHSHTDISTSPPMISIMNLQTRSENRPSILKAKAEGKPKPGGSGILKRNDGIAYSLDTSCGQAVLQGQWRRLTPQECFRLMGFFDDEIKFGDLKDSKLYFLAGNGWDINTASKIFKQMFIGNSNKQKFLDDF